MTERLTRCVRCSKVIWVKPTKYDIEPRCDGCRIVREKVVAMCADQSECDFRDDPCPPGYCNRFRVELTYADGSRHIKGQE